MNHKKELLRSLWVGCRLLDFLALDVPSDQPETCSNMRSAKIFRARAQISE